MDLLTPRRDGERTVDLVRTLMRDKRDQLALFQYSNSTEGRGI